MASDGAAVASENFEMVEFLLTSGADPNCHDEARIGETPLGEVAAKCSLRMAETLVTAGADPTIPGWVGLTALDRAAKRKKPEGKEVYEEVNTQDGDSFVIYCILIIMINQDQLDSNKLCFLYSCGR